MFAASLTFGKNSRAALLLWPWLLAAHFSAPVALAQTTERPLEIRSAFLDLAQPVLLLSARLEFSLPAGAREAVREGAALTLKLQFELSRPRRFWLDNTAATLEQQYVLSYHALSERYILRNLNSDERSTHGTLDAALAQLKSIEALPMLDRSLLDPTESYEARLRITLDVQNLPDALRWVLFWADDWRQNSDWFVWPLKL
ncbi:MAG: DUF4390 domain-containing protein [Candidatus Obscuribacterales bacterium]|nr:DUF4390 domain-containing protein [Steroidobacteraceae bacterium]